MSETELVQKKKQKKKFDRKKAVIETMPLVINYRKALGELTVFTYNIYMDIDESEEWEKYCNEIGFDRTTVEGWHRDHNLPSKTFLINHEFGEPLGELPNEENYINSEIETSVGEQEPDVQVQMQKTHDVLARLRNVQNITIRMFDVDEQDKQKLIKELQITIKKLNGLLLRVESNIKEE